MNTNPDQQDFEALRRLLKLKRHEKPPPRYFNGFSSQILARIRADAPEDRSEIAGRLAQPATFFKRLFAGFQSQPIFATALGAAACGLLFWGAISSDQIQPILPSMGLAGTTVQPLPGSEFPPVLGTRSIAGNSLLGSSTNPLPAQAGSIFDLIQPGTQPASFRPGQK